VRPIAEAAPAKQLIYHDNVEWVCALLEKTVVKHPVPFQGGVIMQKLSIPVFSRSLIVATAAGLLLSAGAASAADLFKKSRTTVYQNDITLTNNVKYVNYVYTPETGGETLHVTLAFSGSCPVVNPQIFPPPPQTGGVDFVSLGSRVPNGFTPKGVTGVVGNVDGTTHPGIVTFDIAFDTLKKAGEAKQFGMAHLDLNLAVDDDCNVLTDPEPVKIGVQVSVSTAGTP
jgi:hypothetical protein